MATTSTPSNYAMLKIGAGEIDLSSDTFKIILMDTDFTFNPDSHAELSDVTDYQLDTGNGYTQDSYVLSNGSYSHDNTNNQAVRTFDNPSWTASGGSI